MAKTTSGDGAETSHRAATDHSSRNAAQRVDQGEAAERADERDASPASVQPHPAEAGSAEADPSRERLEPQSAPKRRLRLLAVSGAKGGVGCTFVSANLALYLASLGRRVVVVDADSNGANLHTWLEMPAPTSLQAARRSARNDSPLEWLPQALSDAPYTGLKLLHLGLDEPGASAAQVARRWQSYSELRGLDADYVVVDLGAGAHGLLLDAYLAADRALFVTVPEPTAMDNTYRFTRGLFARRLLQAAQNDTERKELQRRLRGFEGAPPPLDFVEQLEAERHPLAAECRRQLEAFRPLVVVNQTRLRADLELGSAMASATRRRYGVRVECLGHIDHDDTVWTCLRKRRSVLVETPGAKSSRKIEKIARRLLAIDSGKAPRSPELGVPWRCHHDVLEVERGATDEEVRRAFKRCKEVYASDALCCYGLFARIELDALRARLEEAYDVLLDPARRRPYELSVFAQEPEPPPAKRLDRELTEPFGPPPEITPDTQFNGSLLRAVRQAKQIELRDISQVTKISVSHLKSVEEDNFGLLPAAVYVHGYVTEVAKCLGLDPRQVSRTYLRRYRQYLHQQGRY